MRRGASARGRPYAAPIQTRSAQHLRRRPMARTAPAQRGALAATRSGSLRMFGGNFFSISVGRFSLELVGIGGDRRALSAINTRAQQPKEDAHLRVEGWSSETQADDQHLDG